MFDHSDQLNEIATALTAAQGKFEAVAKDSENPFFKSKYAGLPQVVKAASPILAENGLSVAQLPGHDDQGDNLTTVLMHTSGQFIASTMRLRPIKNDPQAQGSALTYGRRYSYMAALGLVADEDDDGNAATRTNGHTPEAQAAPAQPTEKAATAKQRGLINVRASEKRLDAQRLADILCAAAGADVRTFENPEAAQQFVNRQLDRLPGRLVDPVLKGIEQAEAEDGVPF